MWETKQVMLCFLSLFGFAHYDDEIKVFIGFNVYL